MNAYTRTLLIRGLLLMTLWLLSACQTAPPVAANRLTEAQIVALEKEGFTRTDEGWEFSASDKLLFGFNEHALQPEARAAVERIARILNEVRNLRVRVDGHADAIGSDAYNNQLSLRRAQTVAEALTASGVTADAISVHAFGKSSPVASNQTAAGRSQNRRVAIVLSVE